MIRTCRETWREQGEEEMKERGLTIYQKTPWRHQKWRRTWGPKLARRREGEWEMAPRHPELTAEHPELTADWSAVASAIAAVTSGKTDSGLYLGQWLICAMDLAIFRPITNAYT